MGNLRKTPDGVCHNNVYRIFKMAYQGMGPFAKYCVPV